MIADNGSTALVDESSVQVDHVPETGEVDGLVQAYLIEEPEGEDKALIELPGEPVTGGLRTWIPRTLFYHA